MSIRTRSFVAITEFNGKEVNGRNLNVSEAKPREERGGGSYGGGGSSRW